MKAGRNLTNEIESKLIARCIEQGQKPDSIHRALISPCVHKFQSTRLSMHRKFIHGTDIFFNSILIPIILRLFFTRPEQSSVRSRCPRPISTSRWHRWGCVYTYGARIHVRRDTFARLLIGCRYQLDYWLIARLPLPLSRRCAGLCMWTACTDEYGRAVSVSRAVTSAGERARTARTADLNWHTGISETRDARVLGASNAALLIVLMADPIVAHGIINGLVDECPVSATIILDSSDESCAYVRDVVLFWIADRSPLFLFIIFFFLFR